MTRIRPIRHENAVLRRSLVALGVACLALRAIIPLGYMPGNLLGGEFMVLCPTGMPAGMVDAHQSGHAGHEQSIVEADKSCPIGSALQPAWLPTDLIEPQATGSRPDYAGEYNDQSVTTTPHRRYNPRAPPQA